MSKQIFEKYKLGNLSLNNRIVMAPLTRSRADADGNVPNALMAGYYTQRAGAGLIITEGTSPSPNGLGYPRIPACYSDEQVEGWRGITKAVHAAGGKIFLQIMHTGRVSHPLNMPVGSEVLAPSAIGLKETKMYTDAAGEQPCPQPKAMTAEQLESTREEFVTCAKRAIEAGFDGVELHAANGYLLEQFIHPDINKREDKYGGSIENRLRYVIEVAEAVVQEIGKERTAMRLSPYGAMNETGSFDGVDETYARLVERLNDLGLVYLHVTDHSSMGAPEVPNTIKKTIRDKFDGTLILCGGYDEERAEKNLQADQADLIAFGRPWIANPDLVERYRQDAPINDPDPATFYTPGKEGYIDYPALEAV